VSRSPDILPSLLVSHWRILYTRSQRGVCRAPDLLPEDYMGTGQDSGEHTSILTYVLSLIPAYTALVLVQ
jgi:hypothetical protein